MFQLWRERIDTYWEKQSTQAILIAVSWDNPDYVYKYLPNKSQTNVLICEWLKHFFKLLKLTEERHTYSQSRHCILFCIFVDAIC